MGPKLSNGRIQIHPSMVNLPVTAAEEIHAESHCSMPKAESPFLLTLVKSEKKSFALMLSV